MLFSTGLFAASITGTVKDKTGKGISSAKVVLLIDGKVIHETQSDPKGMYEFMELTSGHYSIYAEAKSYYRSLPQSIVLTEQSEKTINFILSFSKESVIVDELQVVDCEETMPVMEKSISMSGYHNMSEQSYNARSIGYADLPTENFNTESYDFIKENRFHSVLDEPLSTFSIDVDKASYSNVRRFLNNNQKPPIDAIRIEELINYFDYDYPLPTDGHPFATHIEYGDCPWNNEHKLLLIGIKGDEIDTNEIPPSNFVFLIDVSGSMQSPNKLPLLKKSFHILTDNIRPKDKVAIVVYSGSVGCVLESTPGSEKETIKAAINRLEAGGSTAGGAGIQLAYKIAKQNFIPNGNNRVILATDGDFNVGVSSNSELVRMIEEKRDDGIFLSILGFGMGNYKDSKMEQLSNKGNGNYAYIDNILEAKKVFSDELWGTLYTIAKDVKIQIEFNPSVVESYRLIGYENRMLNNEDFNDDKKDAGEIGSGHTITALYEIIPKGVGSDKSLVDDLIYQERQTKKSSDLMTLKIRYKSPDENTSQLITHTVKAKSKTCEELSDNYRLVASVAMFGMILRNSEHKANANWGKTMELAKSAVAKDEYGYRNEFLSLIEKAKYLLY